ncbi:MAG TPA: hypothetical protein VER11_33340 [Polyangiaceae bacterium]|nr:hypothetical protein [Polyangiaceae bacterium]
MSSLARATELERDELLSARVDAAPGTHRLSDNDIERATIQGALDSQLPSN